VSRAAGPTVTWCEHAWLGADGVRAGVVLEVVDGRYTVVRPGVAEPPPGATVVRGVTLPGLVNAHSHAFHRALRGRTHAPGPPAAGGADTFWTWREQMYALATRLAPDTYHALARAAFAEMALAGITTVGEFHYLHDGSDEMGEALVDAARAAGVRITLLDSCYLRGGFDRPKQGAQCRFGDRSVDAWADRVEAVAARHAGDADVRVGAAVHSVRAVGPSDAAVVARWARERGAPLHAHVSEQPAEVDDCLRAHGTTPILLLERAGAVEPGFCGVHATHARAEELVLMGAVGAAVCLCPTTERDLGDGAAPVRLLAEHGVGLCLGTDSHAMVDLFEEARAVELDERLVSGRRAVLPPDRLLHAATAQGAAALGWADVGALAPGRRADAVTVTLDSVRLAGAPADALDAAVVFAATAADVVRVVVDGRVVAGAGRHRLVPDVPAALADAIRALAPATRP
jgi:formiminoglutamate deiminase